MIGIWTRAMTQASLKRYQGSIQVLNHPAIKPIQVVDSNDQVSSIEQMESTIAEILRNNPNFVGHAMLWQDGRILLFNAVFYNLSASQILHKIDPLGTE